MLSPGGRPRVKVANPSDGEVFHWLVKLYAFAMLGLLAIVLAVGLGIYGYFAQTTPETPDLSRYATLAPGVTRVYAADGTVLGEFASEWREIVPYDKLPEKLIQAFLAAEDHEFFSHGGIYVKGIFRALWRNVTAGEFAQGGSTITQQVAKQFLGSEKTLARKAREAIVARRLEARYSKEEILGVYLNHIFLGAGAYGVQAAAKRYFSKDIWELDVAEMALIAGLAQAPSRDSPFLRPESARRRRDAILDKMARFDYLTIEEAAGWKSKPLALHTWEDVFGHTSPYFAEHIRRQIVEKFGADALLKRGLTVETTLEPWVDRVAYENADFAARKQDRRQGWRGPEAHLEGEAKTTFVERQTARYGAGPLVEGRRYLALVEGVVGSGAQVRIGPNVYKLPLKNMSWAGKWSAKDATNDLSIGAATQALKVGDVVWVAPSRKSIRRFSDWSYDEKFNAHWLPAREQTSAAADEVTLEQTPRVQTAIFTADHESGYVVAMVGGQDYARSEYNRAVQACRQPGSTYKPIYYSAALDKGMSFDTMLNDIPKAEVDPVTGEVWVPVNLHGTIDYQVSLENALIFSKNIPSVDVFGKVGAKEVEKWARRLGFTSPIIADRALALGASCVYLHELSRAFAIFARNGRALDLVTIRRVLDRDGTVLEDHSVPWDPALSPAARLDRFAETAGHEVKQAIPARTAYLTTKLLRGVVTQGYSGALRQIEVPVAGKTGTSSATMDLWFTAFTARWVTTLWLGDDLRERPLGKDDAAYMSAVPMWARYMAEATLGQPKKEVPIVPKGVSPHDRGGPNRRAQAPVPTN
jgi:penicillin-binding protein 1A